MRLPWILWLTITGLGLGGCTRVGKQDSSENKSSKGGSRAGSDRPLPGYLAQTADGNFFVQFPASTDAAPFPRIDLAYVVASITADSVTRYSDPVKLVIEDDAGAMPATSDLDRLVAICTRDSQIVPANPAAIFETERLYVPASVIYDSSFYSCFARTVLSFLGDSFTFVAASIDDAAPTGFSGSAVLEEASDVSATWAPSLNGAGNISFTPAAGQENLRHGVAIWGGAESEVPATCGSGTRSFLLSAGTHSVVFSGQLVTEPLHVLVCAVNGQGVASSGVSFTLDPAAQVSSSTSTSTSTSSTSSGGTQGCPTGGVEYPGDASNCYFLGEAGSSCTDVCMDISWETLQGWDPSLATIDFIGYSNATGYDQATNRTRCQGVLTLLTGENFAVETAHNPGLGCHTDGTGQVFYFDTDFYTTQIANSADARRVCSCAKP